MDIELCKKEFFLLDEELESFKDFLNDPTKNIYHSIDGVKIVKSENGELCGVGRIPHRLKNRKIKKMTLLWLLKNRY